MSKVIYAVYNGNGNVSELISTNGAIAGHYEYSPFGGTVALTGSLAKENSFRFSSKYYDSETGAYYYGHRFYQPTTGRWLSSDPIGEEGGPNIFCFVVNNPLSYVDFLGLAEIGKCCCCCVEDLDFEKLDQLQSWDPTVWTGNGWRGQMNYNFKFSVKLSLHTISGNEKAGDCSLQYLEKEKVSEEGGPSQWSAAGDSYESNQNSPIFSWWNNRNKKCDSSEEGDLEDSPGLSAVLWTGIGKSRRPNRWRTVSKELRIKVVVKSASDCRCSSDQKVIKIKMKMALLNGVPDWDHSLPPEKAGTF